MSDIANPTTPQHALLWQVQQFLFDDDALATIETLLPLFSIQREQDEQQNLCMLIRVLLAAAHVQQLPMDGRRLVG